MVVLICQHRRSCASFSYCSLAVWSCLFSFAASEASLTSWWDISAYSTGRKLSPFFACWVSWIDSSNRWSLHKGSGKYTQLGGRKRGKLNHIFSGRKLLDQLSTLVKAHSQRRTPVSYSVCLWSGETWISWLPRLVVLQKCLPGERSFDLSGSLGGDVIGNDYWWIGANY